MPFGLIKFEGKKMSTRKGTVIFIEDVLEEAVQRAHKLIEMKNPNLPNRKEVAEEYTYARANKLLNHGLQTHQPIHSHAISSETAWDLTCSLIEFNSVANEAAMKREPSIFARYLLEVAKRFNQYYHQERILTENIEETNAKLFLVNWTAQTIKKGLNTLGIQTPNQI